jgi:hypothetical protein
MSESKVPTPALYKCLTKALATVQTMAPQVNWMEELAKVCPEIEQAVAGLVLKHEHVDRIARVGLGNVSPDTPVPTQG